MKHFRLFLILLLSSLPLKSFALFGVGDVVFVAGITDPDFIANMNILSSNSIKQSVSLGQLVGLKTQSNIIDGQVYREVNGTLGSALAMAPGTGRTFASINAKQLQRDEAQLIQMERANKLNVKRSQSGALSPKEIYEKVKAFMAGDPTKPTRDEAERRYDMVIEKLQKTFSMEALSNLAADVIEDVLSCQTPQIDAVFPNFNLDIDPGLMMCDYKQIFSDMKEQVNAVSERGWGGTFTINGRPASEVIKNKDLLKDAIQTVPPSMGHRLTMDFFSDQSVNASVRASVDTSALGREIAMRIRGDKRKFGDYTLMDAMDDSMQVQYKISQMAAANAAAANELQAYSNQIDAMESKAREEERFRKEVNNNYGRNAGLFYSPYY